MPTVPLGSSSPEFPALVKRLERLGITYARSADHVDEAQELSRLREVLHAFQHLDTLIDTMERKNEVARQALPAEIMNIRARLFSLIMSGVFGTTDGEMKDLIFNVVPALQRHE